MVPHASNQLSNVTGVVIYASQGVGSGESTPSQKISTPHKINTTEPIDKKIGRIDYTREGASYTKFGRNPFTGGFWANG